MNLKEIYPCSA